MLLKCKCLILIRWKTRFISDENLVIFYVVFHLGIKVHPWYPNGGHLLAFALTAWVINEFENLHVVSCLICFPFKISVLWLWPSQSQLNNNNNIIIFISIQTFHWPFNSLSSDVNMYILLTALQIFLIKSWVLVYWENLFNHQDIISD